jgi:hypothetical protein
VEQAPATIASLQAPRLRADSELLPTRLLTASPLHNMSQGMFGSLKRVLLYPVWDNTVAAIYPIKVRSLRIQHYENGL